MPPDDEVLPAEEQPLSAATSPTDQSPGYILESDPEEDPKEDNEDPEEDPADYPADRDDDEEEEEPSRDDADDEDEDEDEDEEEKEEHPAPADSVPPVHQDRPEVCLPPQKRLCSTQGPRYEVRESSSAAAARPTGGCKADYGFVVTMDTKIRRQRANEAGYGIRDV
ncbi:hypothetical protein Tco_0772704 [Tanacetum coccineum]|uniref:Uncharacterized protein n=1 Tax=Tanacetum coccineum TaxID=301880 RepID=A0ABQ4ZMR2_9ASTR